MPELLASRGKKQRLGTSNSKEKRQQHLSQTRSRNVTASILKYIYINRLCLQVLYHYVILSYYHIIMLLYYMTYMLYFIMLLFYIIIYIKPLPKIIQFRRNQLLQQPLILTDANINQLILLTQLPIYYTILSFPVSGGQWPKNYQQYPFSTQSALHLARILFCTSIHNYWMHLFGRKSFLQLARMLLDIVIHISAMEDIRLIASLFYNRLGKLPYTYLGYNVESKREEQDMEQDIQLYNYNRYISKPEFFLIFFFFSLFKSIAIVFVFIHILSY